MDIKKNVTFGKMIKQDDFAQGKNEMIRQGDV